MKLKSAVVTCLEDKEVTKEGRAKAHSPNLGEYMYVSKLNPINGHYVYMFSSDIYELLDYRYY